MKYLLPVVDAFQTKGFCFCISAPPVVDTVHPGDSYLPYGYPFILPSEGGGGGRDTLAESGEEEGGGAYYNVTLIKDGFRAVGELDVSFLLSRQFASFCWELMPWTKQTFSEMENKELKVIVILMVILVLTFIHFVRMNVSLERIIEKS